MTALSRSLEGALRELARVPRLLVALDFDGTLAPEVDSPEKARALPEAVDAMRRLAAAPRTRLALVSGRALASLLEVSEAGADVLLVGSHGVEFRLDEPGAGLPLAPDEVVRVGALRRALDAVVDELDEVWLEAKPAGFALHTPLASAEVAERAQADALAAAEAAVEGVTVRRGKNVLEFSVRSATKGEAVDQLRRYTQADAVLFAGDDVTDEDAFQALLAHDVGVKCGPGETAATFRVDAPEDVAHVLATLATFRDGDVHEQ